MSTVVLLVAVVASTSAFGLAGMAWLATRRMESDLQGFTGFEGMHFDL